MCKDECAGGGGNGEGMRTGEGREITNTIIVMHNFQMILHMSASNTVVHVPMYICESQS